jgi:hypothetical protein
LFCAAAKRDLVSNASSPRITWIPFGDSLATCRGNDELILDPVRGNGTSHRPEYGKYHGRYSRAALIRQSWDNAREIFLGAESVPFVNYAIQSPCLPDLTPELVQLGI